MNVLSGFPVEFSLDEVLSKLKISSATAGRVEARTLFEKANSLVHPKTVHTTARIARRHGDELTIEGIRFTSHVLARNLRSTDTVFPYVLTIGEALENESRACRNVFSQLVLEELGNLAIASSVSYLERHICQKHGYKILSNMSPGELDWPLDQQSQLFSLLVDVEKAIGVRLTDSMLMMPRKSVSGFLFPTEVRFITCQLCERPSCPSRRVQYDETLKREYFSGIENC